MLEINGRRVEVSDGFMSLSPDQQAAEVDEIASHLGIAAQAQGGGAEPDPVMDAVKSIPDALVTGTAAIPGAIGDVPHLAETFANYAYGQTAGRVSNYFDGQGFTAKPPEQVAAENQAAEDMIRENSSLPLPRIPKPWEVISTQKVKDFVKPITGEMHQPETTLGKYTHAAVTFAPAAAVGGGSALQRVGQAVIPGVASEAAGQLTEGSGYEPWARALAAIVASGGTAMLQRQPPEQAVTRSMGEIDQATLTQAARLRLEAQRIGIDLSWPEAVQQVSGSATRLSDLQRVVENSTGGGPVMREFYADRPQQIDAAARQQFDQIAPQPMIPERLGPRVQRAAEGEIDATQAAINQQTRPLYQAAEQQVLPPNHPALQDPAFLEAVRRVRSNPVIGPRLAHLPDNSIGVIDAVQKDMRARAEGREVRAEGMNPYEASLTREARRQVTNEARNRSPEYDAAVQFQRQARDQYLNPLQEGPTGKIAATTDVGAQTRALFPSQPQAQSEAGVQRAMRGIGRTDPQGAENIVRQHLETAFNEATQRTQAGQNPFGGAKFSAVIAGNPQQRRNLFAAIRELPNGSVMWRGFNRFLDVMEATGKRPAPDSMTEFNNQLRKELEQGPLTGEAITIAASPQKAFSFIKDGYARFRLGRGTEQLARLFTQGNLRDFQRLLRTGPNSPQAVAIMVRLIGQANAAVNAPSAPAN